MIAMFVLLVIVGVVIAGLTSLNFTSNRGKLRDRYQRFSHFKKMSARLTACGLDSPGPWPMEAYEDWRYVNCPLCQEVRPR